MTREIYLDHASGTPMDEAARSALMEALERFGDPLRLHRNGRDARRALEDARERIAAGLGAQPDEIVFTSGGTESVALGIWGAVRSRREIGHRIVVGAAEHPAVSGIGHTLENDGIAVAQVRVDQSCRIDLDKFAAEIRVPGTILASVQHANQEVGTIQPVAEAARLAREAGVIFHTDACQTAGRLPLDMGALEVDLLSISGHKFGGPPGVGALYVRRGVAVSAYPCGDDRERKRRSGMENTPGVVAMAAAMDAARERLADTAAEQWALSDRLRQGISERVPAARVHGHPTHRVPHLVCFSIADLDPEVLLMALDERGIRIGGGSLCNGSAHDPSPVLEAMGCPNTVSYWAGLGSDSSEADVDTLIDALPSLVLELQQMENASEQALARFRRSSEA